MTEFQRSVKTNHFRVKDVAAFVDDLKRYGVTVIDDSTGSTFGETDYVLLYQRPDGTDGGAVVSLSADDFWPSFETEDVVDRLMWSDDEYALPEDFDYTAFIEALQGVEPGTVELNGVPLKHKNMEDLIVSHLADKEVVRIISLNNEMLDYLNGTVVVVNSDGGRKETSLLGEAKKMMDELSL